MPHSLAIFNHITAARYPHKSPCRVHVEVVSITTYQNQKTINFLYNYYTYNNIKESFLKIWGFSGGGVLPCRLCGYLG